MIHEWSEGNGPGKDRMEGRNGLNDQWNGKPTPMSRRNLQLLTNATVRKVLVGGVGPGVSSTTPTGRRQTVCLLRSHPQRRRRQHPRNCSCCRESATPQSFSELAIVVQYAPEVGKNPLDHLIAPRLRRWS